MMFLHNSNISTEIWNCLFEGATIRFHREGLLSTSVTTAFHMAMALSLLEQHDDTLMRICGVGQNKRT